MLRRDREPKQTTFADQARAALSVPEEHPLLQMKRAVDWDAVEAELAVYYASGEGRPSWPPAVLVRMLILEQYGDLSDREVHEQVGYNLLYRAFVGLVLEDAVPDDTTLVRFRQRVGEAGLRTVFETLNRQWEAAGLIGAERRVLDGVHLWCEGSAALLDRVDARGTGAGGGGGRLHGRGGGGSAARGVRHGPQGTGAPGSGGAGG